MLNLFLAVHFELLGAIAMALRWQLQNYAIGAGTVQRDLHILAHQVDIKLGGLNVRVPENLHELVGTQSTSNPIRGPPMPQVLELQQGG